MAEHVEEPEAEVAAGPPDLSAAAALAVGLKRSRSSPNTDGDAKLDAFLDEQTGLVRLQKEHLHEQRELQTSRLRLGRWKDRISLTLQAMTVVVGLAAVGAVGAMAWQAHRDRGVAIQAFSVPPDLAQRGLTGQVVASELLDRLSDLQAQTVTARPASTYANDWGGDIKVEIPETGVSIGELNRWLRQWLGNETRISGEVVRTPTGLAVTARADAASGHRFEGTEADLDKLVAQTAEAIYAETQPYRHAAYLASHGRRDEALARYAWLAEHGDKEDRAWAYTGWGDILQGLGQARDAQQKASNALQLDPNIEPAHVLANNSQAMLGHDEKALAGFRNQLSMLESGHAEGVRPGETPLLIEQLRGALIPSFLGDHGQAADTARRMPARVDVEGASAALSWRAELVGDLAALHEVSAARRAATDAPQSPIGMDEQKSIAWFQEDWSSWLALRDLTLTTSPKGAIELPPARARSAMALAWLGRQTEAQALVAQTPLDCAPCLAARGMIEALAGNREGADRWLAEATRQTPSIPDGYELWGRMLLRLGDADGAIAKAKEAHKRGPRWADPLELWGEALMKKGDFASAAAKFAEADKNAPRWGRNHLRWGQALLLAGRYREARAQYQAANGLDLSRPDRAALTVFLDRTAKGSLHG